jgi:RNA polymerase sigma-70 factor (ECF subfamily)
MTQLNDRELIAAASQGQVAAFANLIGRYRDVRTRFALRMLGDYDMADEALQASYLRAFQTISRCREPEHFEDWLFRIVINECRARALRRAVRSRRVTGEVDAIADWRAAVEGTENGADVQRALDQIDPINREAFILQYIEELTYPQIAALTGASVVTLERQVDRACSRLRELLPDWQKDKPGSLPGLAAAVDNVGPSFPVRVSLPLRRAEVLNESFDDRLMTKLLRVAASPEEATAPAASEARTAPMLASKTKEAIMPAPLPSSPPPSPATMPEPRLFPGGFSLKNLPRLPRIGELGIALIAIAIAFAWGYGLRGRRDARRIATASGKTKSAAAKIVRRVDTVRVARGGDTVVLARFVFADANAKAVALLGDFNRWDADATPLAKSTSGGWSRTMRLTPGRYEYAFLVDGKRWVTDRFGGVSHDAFDVETSVLAATGRADAESDGAAASTRLRKLLPHKSAERVIATIASARGHGLPATALENRALKFAARHVKPSDIEDAIVADAEAMTKAGQLLAAAGRRDPAADEIDAAAQLLGEGADSASIGALAKFASAGRSIDVPLRVAAELVATSASPRETVAHIEDRVRSGATDAQLEALLDAPRSRVAADVKGKGKDARVATKTSSTSVRQAGASAKSPSSTKTRKKTSEK